MFSSLFTELRITDCSAFNVKARMVEQKTHLIFADTCEKLVGNQYGGCGLSHLLESILKELCIFRPTFLAPFIRRRPKRYTRLFHVITI